MKKLNFLSIFGFLSILFGIGFLFNYKSKNIVNADIYIDSTGKQVYVYKLNVDFQSEDYENSFIFYSYNDNDSNFTYVYCLTNNYVDSTMLNNYKYPYIPTDRLIYCSNTSNSGWCSVDWSVDDELIVVSTNFGTYNYFNTSKEIYVFSTLTIDELINYQSGSFDYDTETGTIDEYFDLINYNQACSILENYQLNASFNLILTETRQNAFQQGYEKGKEDGFNEAHQPFTFLSVVSNMLNYEFLPGLKISYLVAISLGLSILLILIKSILR